MNEKRLNDVTDTFVTEKNNTEPRKPIPYSDFQDCFYFYHLERIRHWKVSTLVEQEKLLSEILDSHLLEDLVLIDEIICLYDLVRDECVSRLEKALKGGLLSDVTILK